MPADPSLLAGHDLTDEADVLTLDDPTFEESTHLGSRNRSGTLADFLHACRPTEGHKL